MEFKNIAQRDIPFDGIHLHNPTISELADIFSHEEDFFFVLKLFSLSLKETFGVTKEEITDFEVFQILLLSSQNLPDFTAERKKSILDFLLLIFKDYKVNFNGKAFMFSKNDSIFVLNNRNFDIFKEFITKMFGTEEFLSGKDSDTGFNPIDERAQAIADKIMKGRKKAAEEKGQNNKKGIIENYISILSIGLKIPPFTLCELTFYNLIQEYKRFIAKEEWDLDIKQRLAGGEPQESPDFWMNYY